MLAKEDYHTKPDVKEIDRIQSFYVKELKYRDYEQPECEGEENASTIFMLRVLFDFPTSYHPINKDSAARTLVEGFDLKVNSITSFGKAERPHFVKKSTKKIDNSEDEENEAEEQEEEEEEEEEDCDDPVTIDYSNYR